MGCAPNSGSCADLGAATRRGAPIVLRGMTDGFESLAEAA
jgi:hypothetical protein